MFSERFIIEFMKKIKVVKQGCFSINNYNENNVCFLMTKNLRWCTALSIFNSDLKLGALAHFDLPVTALSFKDIVIELKEQLGTQKIVFEYVIAGGLKCAHSPITRNLLQNEIDKFNKTSSNMHFVPSKVYTFEENRGFTQTASLSLYNGKFDLRCASSYFEKVFSSKFFFLVHLFFSLLWKIEIYLIRSKVFSRICRFLLGIRKLKYQE